MYYKTKVVTGLLERIDFHSDYYSFGNESTRKEILVSTKGVCGAYMFLCQRFGKDNVSPFHLLKMDRSNEQTNPTNTIFNVDNEIIIVITNEMTEESGTGTSWIVPSFLSHEDFNDCKLLIGSVDVIENDYRLLSFDKLSNYKIENNILTL